MKKSFLRYVTARPLGLSGGLLILSLTCLALLSACLVNGKTEKSPPPLKDTVPVTVAAAIEKDVSIELRAIGTVEAVSTVSIRTQINGELTDVHFKEGQDVRKGDLLFTLDPRSLESDLRKAEANQAKDIALV